MYLGFILVALLALSSAHPQFSSAHIGSQFLSDDEIREAADALEKGHLSERLELMSLQETRDLDSTTLSLHSENRHLNLKLTPSDRLIHKNALVRIVDGDKEKYEPFHPSLRSAFYHGYVDDQDQGTVALAKLNDRWTGLVETREDRYILHGVPDSNKHLLVKLDSEDLINKHETNRSPIVREKEFNMTGDESFTREEEFNMTGDESFTRWSDPEFELEIGAYADEDLYNFMRNKFPGQNTQQKIQEMILIILNMVHTFYQKPSMGNRITVLVSALSIMQRNEYGLQKTVTAPTYLNNFCDWDGTRKNPMGANYDIGMMFTGINILDKQGKDTIIGMAPMNRACRFNTKRSCGISEGKGFNAGFTVTHELGHNLGSEHDGQGKNNCAEKGFVMGPQMSPGIADFSSCSRGYFKKYFQQLDDFGENCMRDNGNKLLEHAVPNQLPGQRVAKGEQCSLIWGAGYTEDPTMNNFCRAIGCRNYQTGYYGNAGEAPMPGTPCGNNMVCYDNQCMSTYQAQSTIRNYWTTHSGSTGKALSIDQLCSKYRPGYTMGVDYNWTVKWNYRIDLSLLCTNLMCYNGSNLVYIVYPAPPGTSCAAGKTCRNYKCQ